MQCVFCLEEKPSSIEHVFPYAVGGCLTFDRVCKDCNSWLGATVDPGLTEYPLVLARRSAAGVAGKDGRVPDFFGDVLGTGELVQNPTHKFRVSMGSKGLIARSLNRSEIANVSDGVFERRFVVDEDTGPKVIAKIIQRERKRADVEPLSRHELEQAVAKVLESSQRIENPTFLHKIAFDEASLKLAIMKIIYELAFIWLGESYLTDPIGVCLREVASRRVGLNDTKIEGEISAAREMQPFSWWSSDVESHLAFATTVSGGITVAVRVFDLVGAHVRVTDTAARYLSRGLADQQLRFVRMDPVSRTKSESPLMQELGRIAQSMVDTHRDSQESMSGLAT